MFNLEFDERDAQVIWNALMKLPAEESYLTLRNLDKQLTEQGAFKPKLATPPDAPAEAA